MTKDSTFNFILFLKTHKQSNIIKHFIFAFYFILFYFILFYFNIYLFIFCEFSCLATKLQFVFNNGKRDIVEIVLGDNIFPIYRSIFSAILKGLALFKEN